MCYADGITRKRYHGDTNRMTKKQPSNITFHMSSLSTDGNTAFTPMPSISKNTFNAKCIDYERAKCILLQAILRKKILLRAKIRRQMQRKLVRLWNACTKYEDSQALNSKEKEKKNSDLWNHIQDCCDIDCKEKFCQSSRRIIIPFSKCCKTLNQHSIRNFSATAINHFIEESRASHQLRKKRDGEICIENTKGMDGTLIYDSDENKTSTSNTLEQISGVSQSSHTTARCVDRNTFRHKQHRSLPHSEKHAEGGPDGDSVVQLFLQKPKPVEAEIPLLCTDIPFERKYLSEEEKKERSDVLIALLSLKKRLPNFP